MNDTSKPEDHVAETTGTPGEDNASAALRIVTVRDPSREAMVQPASGDPMIIELPDLNAETFARLQPDVVLSPLVAGGFDCFDVAMALSHIGFGGAYRAVVSFVPDPALVKREVTACCPGLDFDIVITGVQPTSKAS